MFIYDNVAKPQYISGNSDKNELGSLDFLYDFLIKECATNEKLIEESGYTKSASQLGRRSYCTEAEEMRERIMFRRKLPAQWRNL